MRPTGSPEGHLKQNFEISLLGHLPDRKSGNKNNQPGNYPETTRKLPGNYPEPPDLGNFGPEMGRRRSVFIVEMWK